MTKRQCFEVIAYLAAAISKEPLSDHAADVYFDLLGDLPLDVFRLAAKKVVLAHKYATFPTVAELREAASEILSGQLARLTPAACWDIAISAARKIDPDIRGPYWMGGTEYPSQTAAVLASVPSMVAGLMRAVGLPSLTTSREPLSVVRGQFLRMAEQTIAKRRALALIPEGMRKEIEERSRTLPLLPVVAQAVGRIGAVEG